LPPGPARTLRRAVVLLRLRARLAERAGEVEVDAERFDFCSA
jgi:hypothetical protein